MCLASVRVVHLAMENSMEKSDVEWRRLAHAEESDPDPCASGDARLLRKNSASGGESSLLAHGLSREKKSY